jgi:hypothetical protein
MSFSYNNIIDRSKNQDRETNKDFNNSIISISSNKKKSSQEDIDLMVNKTYERIFDVIKLNNKNYFLDKNLGLIWNENTDISGIINKNKYIWFENEDLFHEQALLENNEFLNIINKIIN